MSFKNKTAVITGAGSGIGKSLAQRFAKNGANVVMLDIHKDVVQAAAGAINRCGKQFCVTSTAFAPIVR